MDRIQQPFEKTVIAERDTKKKMAKSFLGSAGLVVGVFIVFAVIVIVTTDIRLISLADTAALGLDLFLLIFCSYSMYVCCADSGMRSAFISASYLEALNRYDELKKKMYASQLQKRIGEFCTWYVQDELKNAREAILFPAGLTYEEYEKYIGMDKETVQALDMPMAQKKTIISANRLHSIKLTPDMLLRRGRGVHRRSALDVNPHTKRNVNYVIKFVQISLISLGLSVIALDVVVEPSWVIFASVCLKLVSVISNGFMGYKAGYENIVFDTVNYVSGQSDLMERAMQYCSDHPNEVK